MEKICIFPIPDCVTFPGTVFPLHVFEPRYRQMINHCLETGRPVAICHTRKEISPGKPSADLQQALSSNQATYQPYDLFSAGPCTLRERLPDGRLVVDVDIQTRYRKGGVVQMLPYQVYECEPVPDRELSGSEQAQCAELRDKIFHRLMALIPEGDAVRAILEQTLGSNGWTEKSHQAFSFEIFGLIRFDAEYLQQILEMDSARDRLAETLRLLNS